ncbi:MAG: hypothetical protein IAF00_07485 [Phycisphaerales bacterium]|nr:hypothetical protein [Phycisphaerales bacterium]
MTSCQRILADINNALTTADLTASSVRPASRQVFRQQTVRNGNGEVVLRGGYIGIDDATVEIEIREASGAVARVTQPVFSGAGNGTMTQPTAEDGTESQVLTVTLVDRGTDTQPARLAIYADLVLVAKNGGEDGNAIRLTVTPDLTLGAAIGSTVMELSKGASEFDNARLDFGAVALDADGIIPAAAPRIVFSDDQSLVYRHYKRWSDGRWLYGFTPPLARDIPAGASVKPVTGTYDVTVTLGATFEVYEDITTLYDWLRAMAGSALLAVEGVIANDRQPNGQAAIDLPLRTDAWVESTSGLSGFAATCDTDLGNDTITLSCEGGGFNSERWTVTSAAEGQLAEAITGVPYHDRVRFQIPEKDAGSVPEPIRLASVRYASRAEGDPAPPPLGVKLATLGAHAVAQTLTLTYKARPDSACSIDDVLPSGAVLPELLGLESNDVATLDPELKARLQALYEYRKEFAVDNSAIFPTPSTIAPRYRGTAIKPGETDRVAYFHADADANRWRDFHASEGWSVTMSATPQAAFNAIVERAPSTAYVLNDWQLVTLPVSGAQQWWKVTTAGTSSSSAASPFYTGTIRSSGTLWDGSVFWGAQGTNAPSTWGYGGTLVNRGAWAPNTIYTVNSTSPTSTDYVTVGGNYFSCGSSGKSGATTDPFYAWAFKASPVTDGTVVWTKQDTGPTGNVWTAGKSVAANSYYQPAGQNYYYVATGTATTGQVEPPWGTADVLQDGAVTWQLVSHYQAQTFSLSGADLTFIDSVLGILAQCLHKIYLVSDARDSWDTLWLTTQNELDTVFKIGGPTEQVTYQPAFLERYRSRCDVVLIEAGIEPGKFEAGSLGSMVWPDPGDKYWWEFEGSNYLPLFTNVTYHSCRKSADGTPVSTQEFAFALVTGCTGRLEEGDSVTIVIGQDGVGYAVGTAVQIVIAGAAPLALAGGRAGTDTLTWAVTGSAAGVLPDYALTLSEPWYAASGIAFGIKRGGIPFALGDVFRFSVEAGGRWRWRKDDDDWSTDLPLAASAALADGLEAVFTEGAAPSFVAGDVHRFRVRQPYSPLHALSADDSAWQWSSDWATLRFDFGSDQAIEAVGVLRHTLTASAVVTVEVLGAANALLAAILLPVSHGPLLSFIDPPIPDARAIRLVITGAIGMSIGWVYAGVPWAAENSANRCVLRRVYALERSDGINPAGTYLGAGRDGELGWDDWFLPADLTSLLALMDDVKSKGDLPVVVVPNLSDTQDAALVRIATDSLEITDEYRFQDETTRQMSLTLPLSAVSV